MQSQSCAIVLHVDNNGLPVAIHLGHKLFTLKMMINRKQPFVPLRPLNEAVNMTTSGFAFVLNFVFVMPKTKVPKLNLYDFDSVYWKRILFVGQTGEQQQPTVDQQLLILSIVLGNRAITQ